MKVKHDWHAFPVDTDIIESAKKIRAQRDAKYGNIYKEFDTDMRHVGEIGEFAVDHFLSSFGTGLNKWLIEGKVTHEADFIFAGKRIGVKTVKRKVDMRMSYGAQITAKHKDEPVDYFFFCCYETHRQQLILLGGIRKDSFLKDARYYKEGDMVHSSYKIRKGHEIYSIGADRLIAPDAFVRKLLHEHTFERGFYTGAASEEVSQASIVTS